ncbi:hypothetical protein GALMADRAFT_242308 [Galerina marginata CBS 339.88]|uniref:Uncharacterized protein n=1 Tax=Galerina marginata (strain CBS 339.88) TaxID=685588 RepID=A0A067TM93_GALM3|nr:hypothetical protein GALMADRAFT_242308 [Galerina marginata CBS 339.88]
MSASQAKKALFYQKCAALGWDADLTQSVISKVRPDPITGLIEEDDILRFMKLYPDDPDAQRIAQLSDEGEIKHEREKVAMPSNINCSKLPVQPNTLWIFQLFSCFEKGGCHDYAERLGVEVLQHNYHMYCAVDDATGVDLDATRVKEQYVTLPDSKTVERFIRMAMAKPMPPFTPCLPNYLILASQFKQHEAELKPFLDSLPKPLEWYVATPTGERGREEEQRRKAIEKSKRYTSLAKEKKEVGNRAFRLKDQAGAVDAFMDGIACVQKAMLLSGDIDSIKDTMAMCYGNCSAARLLDGKGRDAKMALEDAEMAIKVDEFYAKGYIRLSRAYEALGIYSQAEESLARPLRLPQLENHAGLVDCLIALQTDGLGLPTDQDGFMEWSKRVFGNTDSGRRMKNVRGLWRKRCEDYRRVFGRQ